MTPPNILFIVADHHTWHGIANRSQVLKNCDGGLSKALWLEHGWAERNHLYPREALYDLIFDPNEGCNLADDAACAPILDEMRERLDRWMRETHDPLRLGPVPPDCEEKLNPTASGTA